MKKSSWVPVALVAVCIVMLPIGVLLMYPYIFLLGFGDSTPPPPPTPTPCFAAANAKSAGILNDRKPIALYHQTAAVTSLVFASDGSLIAAGSKDKTIVLYNTVTGLAERTLKQDASVLNMLVLDAGKTLASASDSYPVRLWDVSSGQESVSLTPADSSPIQALAASPNGQLLAVASQHTIHLWDLQLRRQLATFFDKDNVFADLAFSPDSTKLASATDWYSVKLWDVNSHKELYTLPAQTLMTQITFSPDGKTLIGASWQGMLKVWDVNSGREIRSFPLREYGGLAFSPDGSLIALLDTIDSFITILDLKQNCEVESFSLDKFSGTTLAFSPDGRLLAAGTNDGAIQIWHLR